MTDSEFNAMLERADRKYRFSDIEKEKIRYLLEYCHATDVRWTLRRMYEVYFRCDAMLGMEITTGELALTNAQGTGVQTVRQQTMRSC